MCNIRTLVNNKGISIIEALIAAFLTAVAVISLMPMQDTSMRVGLRADLLGRASGIMQAELETREYAIMNQNNVVNVTGGVPIVQTFTTSGVLTAVPANVFFNVATSINPLAGAANAWIVNVRVTWPGGPANGITSSIIATRHFNF